MSECFVRMKTTQTVRRMDLDARRARSGDADAHTLEELAQLDDVRLHGGVTDLRRAFRDGSGEQRGLCPGHRRFVEIHRRAGQPIRCVEGMTRLVDFDGPHRAERIQVGGDRPARREIAAGLGETRRSVPREQRTEQ